jgi:hypothetical protein
MVFDHINIDRKYLLKKKRRFNPLKMKELNSQPTLQTSTLEEILGGLGP